MCKTPWSYKEGIVIGAGLILAGVLCQLAFGRIDWDFFAAPVNIAALVLFLSLLVAAHLLRNKVYVFSWLSSIPAAVTSIAYSSILTVVMGLIRQRPSAADPAGFPWLDQMLCNWSFILVWLWMIISLGLTTLRVCFPLRRRRIPFLLNHMGLFIAVTCAVLGSADLQRLKMTARTNAPEWRAIDQNGRIVELPVAVDLKSFNIDEYPPKLMLVDNETGQTLPEGAPENLLLEEGIGEGSLNGWKVKILEFQENAAPVFGQDTVRYNEFHSMGSCSAALVSVSKGDSDPVVGWVSCGSFMFPVKALTLNDKVSVVMPEREPQRYVSVVNIYTESGGNYTDTIQVNKPCRVDGWKIYQYSYDHDMGKWSDYSVFEIIRDPWLPAVYVGILMLMAGAVCMFIQFGTRKKEDEK